MRFKSLAEYFLKIEATPSRIEITRLLADLLKKINKEEIDKVLYLTQGRIAPLYEKIEFGMAEQLIIRSILIALNLEKKTFINRYQKIGDLGKTVEEFKKEISSFDEKNFTIIEVYNNLWQLAKAMGEGSQEKKINLLAYLIKSLDPLSCRYLVRIPAGVMRLGFSDMTILDCLSWMIKGDKSLRPLIEKAYHVRPDIGLIGKLIKEKGIESLKSIQPKVFTPILMMRAERLSSAAEIIKKIGLCAIEKKFDGFRLQIHYNRQKKEVKLYSRNLEDVTFMYPDLVSGVKNEIKAEELIFEGEAIGFDPHTGNFLPFQETVQRKRKYDVEKKVKEIPLKLFAFELLYLNGKSYINNPFIERRKSLASLIKKDTDYFNQVIILANQEVVGTEKKIDLLFDQAISEGLEGIIAKKLDGIYQPGARGWNWIKYKKSYSTKISDTVDCLVMGYDLGRGKRASFGIGAFLVGVYDEKKDSYVTVAKIGTGLSDEEWKRLKKECAHFQIEKKPEQYQVDKLMKCDIWLNPKIVVEIRADEISRSPVHTAGRVMKPSKTGESFLINIPGFSLRFPRLERFRPDKRPEDVTTLKEIELMFKNQIKK